MKFEMIIRPKKSTINDPKKKLLVRLTSTKHLLIFLRQGLMLEAQNKRTKKLNSKFAFLHFHCNCFCSSYSVRRKRGGDSRDISLVYGMARCNVERLNVDDRTQKTERRKPERRMCLNVEEFQRRKTER